jgi:hypothetical protein
MWDGFAAGLNTWVGRMKAASDQIKKLLPFLFANDKPTPQPSRGMASNQPRDWRAIGAAAGYQTFNSLFSGIGAPNFSAQATPRALVPPPKPSEVKQINTTVTLDGRVIARVVSTHQERGLEQANRSAAGSFDGRRSLAPVGLGVA